MMKNFVQIAAAGLLVTLCLVPSTHAGKYDPGADPQQVAEEYATRIAECQTTGLCAGIVEELVRCVLEDTGLCFVCYDFHGAMRDQLSPMMVIEDSLTGNKVDQFSVQAGRFSVAGFGFGEDGETFGHHVVEYNVNGNAACE